MATTTAAPADAAIAEQQRRYNDFVALLQPRTPTFRQTERDALVELVCEYFDVEKNGKLLRTTFVKDNQKVLSSKVAWQEITTRFNSNPNFSKRAVQQLRKCWMNMRTRDKFTPAQRLRLGLDQTGKKRRTINSKLRSLSGQTHQIRITKNNSGSVGSQVGSVRSRQQQYRKRPPSRAGRPMVSRGPQKYERQTLTPVFGLTDNASFSSRQHLVAGGRNNQNHPFIQNRPTARASDYVRHGQQVHKASRGPMIGGNQGMNVASRRPASSGQAFREHRQVVPVRMFRNTNSTVSNPAHGELLQTEPNVFPSSFAQGPTVHRGDYRGNAISNQAEVVPAMHAIQEGEMEYPIQIGVLPTGVGDGVTGTDPSTVDGRQDQSSETRLLDDLGIAPMESGPVILSVTSIIGDGSGPEKDVHMEHNTSELEELELVIKTEDNDESRHTCVNAVPLPRASQAMVQQTQENITVDHLDRRVNSNQTAVAQERQSTTKSSLSEGSQRTSNLAERDNGQHAMSSGGERRRTDGGIQRQKDSHVASGEQRINKVKTCHVGHNVAAIESRAGNDGTCGQVSSVRQESSGVGRERAQSEKDSTSEEENKARLDILRYEAMKAREEAELARCRRELLEVEVASAKQQMELTRLRQEAEIELIRQQVRQERAKADKMAASQASSPNSKS